MRIPRGFRSPNVPPIFIPAERDFCITSAQFTLACSHQPIAQPAPRYRVPHRDNPARLSHQAPLPSHALSQASLRTELFTSFGDQFVHQSALDGHLGESSLQPLLVPVRLLQQLAAEAIKLTLLLSVSASWGVAFLPCGSANKPAGTFLMCCLPRLI